jgi:oligopeptide transport system permease protein
MTRFLIKKIFTLFLSLFVVASLTFVLMHSIPGDPFMEERAIPEEILNALHKHYGLDQPWHVQYYRYMKGFITFDLGPSFIYKGRTVTEMIREGFPVSMALGLEALILSVFFGIALGSIAALKHLRWQDHLITVLVVLGISIPSFILATFLQYLVSIKWDLLPVALWGSFEHSILPALALAALPTTFIARLTRSNMIEIMQEDYIQTARAKGLNPYQIVVRHALRNALLPIVTYLGPLTAGIMTGSFAVEKIFGIPGLGQWFVTSIINHDYTFIMGTSVFYSAILMLCVFFVDILYCFIDPRIQLVHKKVEL